MKYLPLRARVDAAFDTQTAQSFGPSYLEALLTGWREITQSLRRSLVLVVVLMAVFFLLKNSKNVEFTLGPIKSTNVASVLAALPVLVSVLIYECVGLGRASAMFRETVGEVLRRLHPSVCENDLEVMMAPPTLTLVGNIGKSWQEIRKSPPGLPNLILDVTAAGAFVTIVVAGFGFLIYTYVYLYRSTHVNPLLVSFSLAATTLYAIRAIALAIHTLDQY